MSVKSPHLLCVCEEKWTSTLTWTVLHIREGFADVDVKAARFDSICIYGDPGAVVSIPDQVPQVVLVPVGIYR